MPTPENEPSWTWSQLLDDDNVLVLTKLKFFRTLERLAEYARHPERRTWEFFTYRFWGYILAVFCETCDIQDSAFTCGAQHPCIIRRLSGQDGSKIILEYCLPDFVLIFNASGDQDSVVLIGEVKPLGSVEPDTQDAQEAARSVFLETETQRQKQARLTFELYPKLETVKILMMSGAFWSVWTYKREDFLLDLPPQATSSSGQSTPTQSQRGHPPPDTAVFSHGEASDQSPPHKLRRTARTFFRSGRPGTSLEGGEVHGQTNSHSRQEGNNDNGLSPVPSPPTDRKDRTWRPTLEEQPLPDDIRWDHHPPKAGRAPKRSTAQTHAPSTPEPDAVPAPVPPKVHHILQLPRKDALNPWFRHFLGDVRDTLTADITQNIKIQKSWFDWPSDVEPEGDGYEPGYVLPSATQPTAQDTNEVVVDLVRVDGPPNEDSGDAGKGLSPNAANALMSPGLSHSAISNQSRPSYMPAVDRTPVSKRRFVIGEEATELPQLPEVHTSDAADDATPSPAPQRSHRIQSVQRPHTQEPSPTVLSLERRQQDPSSSGFAHNSTSPTSPDPTSELGTDEFGEDVLSGTLNDLPPTLPSIRRSVQIVNSGAPSALHSREPDPSSGGDAQPSNLRPQAGGYTVSNRAHRERMVFGPLLVDKLPSGRELPPGFATMPREDQELLLRLETPVRPRGRQDFESAFRGAGMPSPQVRQVMRHIRERAPNVALPPHALDDPPFNLPRAGCAQGDPSHPTASTSTGPVPSPVHASAHPFVPTEAGFEIGGNDGLVSVAARRPMADTELMAGRAHGDPRHSALEGGNLASSMVGASNGPRERSDDTECSLEARRSAQGPPESQRQRPLDSAAATRTVEEVTQSLRLGSEPSTSNPAPDSDGETSTNRKRKERQTLT